MTPASSLYDSKVVTIDVSSKKYEVIPAQAGIQTKSLLQKQVPTQ